MHLALLALTFQLGLAAHPVATAGAWVAAARAADSVRDLRLARSAQASFERSRRYNLPEGGGSSGRCDVQLGRYCWWYDEVPPNLPPEADSIGRRRAELLATLDALGERHPGDDWIAGMRVHYRIDGKNAASADSVARACGATTWWCLALVGYADHRLGRPAAAESAFVDALAAMPDSAALQVARHLGAAAVEHAPLLRAALVRRAAAGRGSLLAPQSTAARRRGQRLAHGVLRSTRAGASLYRQATSTLQGAWGRDNEELLLRYGWPIGWRGRRPHSARRRSISVTEYHPTPSYNFAPDEALYDTSAPRRRTTGGSSRSRTPSRATHRD